MAKKLIIPNNPAYAYDYFLGYSEQGDKIAPELMKYQRASNDYNYDGDLFLNNEPRIERDGFVYLDLERTNLLTYSNEFTNASWSKQNSKTESNTAIAPDGTMTGYKLVEDSSDNLHYIQKTSLTFSGNDVISIYAKAGERGALSLGNTSVGTSIFNLVDGSLISNGGSNMTEEKIEAVGGGWYRCSVRLLKSGSFAALFGVAQMDGSKEYLGNGKSGIYIWNAQLEEGSYPSTYIPTGSSIVTRVTSSAAHDLPSPIDVSSGFSITMKVKGQPYGNGGGSSTPIFRLQKDGSNFLGVSVSGAWRLRMTIDGATPALISVPNSSVTEDCNLGVTANSNGFTFYANGEPFYTDNTTDVSSFIDSFNTLITSQTEARGPLGFKDLVIYDEVLSESKMKKLTK
jgi:hypothetical protein